MKFLSNYMKDYVGQETGECLSFQARFFFVISINKSTWNSLDFSGVNLEKLLTLLSSRQPYNVAQE
ncbi:hypothetical protein HZS_7489 [Henneguya salminicola]|nr:hypothetical protein HZS_7489 [Henneguya salminicola]